MIEWTEPGAAVRTPSKTVTKLPTGVIGLDEITRGGLPEGRATLLFGGAGCGKTVLAMEFLCHGAHDYGEPGLYVSFEEPAADLIANTPKATYPLRDLVDAGIVKVVSVLPGLDPVPEAGEYTLDGLLVRLDHWVREVGARRLVLDSLASLFSRFSRESSVRMELARIIRWTKERGLTTIVTTESRGRGATRHGVEEFVSDCVIMLDHRVKNQLSKRRLRVLKYRGSDHGTDEYPFLITEEGISVLPVTSLGLDSQAPTGFVSTGVAGLDALLDGKGYYRGSTVMISGAAGTGKSTLAMQFALSRCQEGGRALLFTYEESASQLERNMASVGLDLGPVIRDGSLRIRPVRPSAFGLENHLLRIRTQVDRFEPDAVIMDPVTAFRAEGNHLQVRSMLMRVLDGLKGRGITTLMTSLTPGSGSADMTQAEVSSMVDAWIVLRYRRENGARQRALYIHKARGIGHSDELSELRLTSAGPVVVTVPHAAETRG